MEYDVGGKPPASCMGQELTTGFAGMVIRSKIRAMARQRKLCGADQHDLEQQLRVELLRRSERFDSRRGDWRLFVRMVTRRRLASLANRSKRDRKRLRFQPSTDLQGFVTANDRPRRTASTPKDICERAELAWDVERAIQALSLADQRLCRRLQFYSISEVARLTGQSRSTVAEQVVKLRSKLRFLNPSHQAGNSPLKAPSPGVLGSQPISLPTLELA